MYARLRIRMKMLHNVLCKWKKCVILSVVGYDFFPLFWLSSARRHQMSTCPFAYTECVCRLENNVMVSDAVFVYTICSTLAKDTVTYGTCVAFLCGISRVSIVFNSQFVMQLICLLGEPFAQFWNP